MSEEKRKNTDDHEQAHSSPTLTANPKTEGENAAIHKNKAKEHIENAILAWRKFSIMDKTQIILILCNMATIVVFVLVGISQHSDTKKSIALADSSLMLSKRGLDLAQQNFQIENRPYVGIKDISIITFEIGKKCSFAVVYQNYGKTPALEVSGTIRSETHTVPDYVNVRFDGESTGIRTVSVLPPFEPAYHTTVINDVLKRADYFRFINKRFYMYVFGTFVYSDVFGGQDTTSFCAIYDPITKKFGSGPSHNIMK